MAMDSYGAKLTQRDVVDLAQASTNMAVVAETIRSSGVSPPHSREAGAAEPIPEEDANQVAKSIPGEDKEG